LRRIVVILSAFTILGGCSSLVTPGGAAAKRWAALEETRAAKAAGLADQQICKSMKVMGSNFPQKVCSTQAEWDAFDKQAHESVDSYDQQRKAGNTQGAFEN
jgi:hypothetical protein